MRHLIVSLCLSILLAWPARADEAAAQSVISEQIAAFQADDFATAFSYASPTIQRLFGNPETFGIMVQQGYPMVWRPAETRFLDAEGVGDTLWQRVLITDQKGVPHLLEYQMLKGPEGWKINAVQIVEQAPGTA
jgi:hypothetical protein